MTVTTYPAVVRDGRVEPVEPLNLPDGSAVYIVAQVEIGAQTARKKANGWLVEHVGNLVMADDGVLGQRDGRWVWRFNAYLTSLSHAPRGPIGQVELAADTGQVLNDPNTVDEMYQRGRVHTRSA